MLSIPNGNRSLFANALRFGECVLQVPSHSTRLSSILVFMFICLSVFFSGASGGAFAAVLLAADCKIEEEALTALMEIGPNCCRGRWLGAYGVYDNGMRSVFNHIFDGVDLPSKVSTFFQANTYTNLHFSDDNTMPCVMPLFM